MNAVVVQALFLATGLVLLIDIVRHAHGCIGGAAAEASVVRQRALEYRLAAMEKEVKENSMVLSAFLVTLESQFALSKLVDLRELKRQCHVEAAAVVAKLAEDPPPPMPNFDAGLGELDLAVDDVFQYGDDPYAARTTEEPLPSVKERSATCLGWRTQYAVSPGVSWGSLPLELQAKWRAFDCDIYLQQSVQAMLSQQDDDLSFVGDINSLKRRRRRRR
mmetsp:Transcript_27072/g.83115  ORF Transcript_27072/g.83115 Transcript_27072/m.83115 type:complete len:219 (+) Transcript_27072:55-711(+)